MRVEYINPFIESVYGLFDTMLGCTVQRGELSLSAKNTFSGDITGIIGLSGPARGTVALSFPLDTARSMVGRLLRADAHEVTDNVTDGVAELVNIVAGSAKAKFHQGDGSPVINLSLPTVVQGQQYSLDSPSEATWLDVAFRSELGPFRLRVIFDQNLHEKGARG
jgi:chemotaxis protein CheX